MGAGGGNAGNVGGDAGKRVGEGGSGTRPSARSFSRFLARSSCTGTEF